VMNVMRRRSRFMEQIYEFTPGKRDGEIS